MIYRKWDEFELSYSFHWLDFQSTCGGLITELQLKKDRNTQNLVYIAKSSFKNGACFVGMLKQDLWKKFVKML